MAKKGGAPKGNRFTVLTSIEATRMAKPRFDGYACGYGYHGRRGYDRNAEKRRFMAEI